MMTIILIPAGILAALICFRWARTLALWLVVALVVGFFVSVHAHAQSSPMVQCQIGSWAQVMPDYACEAARRGSDKLVPRDVGSIFACAKEMDRTLQASQSSEIEICNGAYQGLMIAAGIPFMSKEERDRRSALPAPYHY
jgi:hypothetical protein